MYNSFFFHLHQLLSTSSITVYSALRVAGELNLGQHTVEGHINCWLSKTKHWLGYFSVCVCVIVCVSGSVCVGCCFCGAQNFAVCHFSTRFACKRNLHLNSILNSYAACNTHRAMRRGRGPEGVTLSACERQSMHACCAVHLCVCVCICGFEVFFARLRHALVSLFWHFTSFLQWISVAGNILPFSFKSLPPVYTSCVYVCACVSYKLLQKGMHVHVSFMYVKLI